MLTDFLRLLIETINFLWPLHIVAHWERSGRYRFGHFRGDVGPGLYFKIPWFVSFVDVSVVPEPFTTGRMDITLQDRSTLSFDATATMRVVDIDKALNEIDRYGTSSTLTVAAVLATKLAEVDAERLAPDKRKRLLSDLRKWINEDTHKFGVECLDVAFNSFVLNVRTFRLLTDASAAQTSL